MRSFAEQNSAVKRGHYAKWSACPPLAGSEILHNSFIYEVFSYIILNIAKFTNIMYNFIII